METSSPTYRITTKSGIVVGNDLPRSAPAIQLQEGNTPGTCPKPTELQPGQYTTVVYPLLDKRKLECKVERIDGITADDVVKWANEHAKRLASSRDEDLEDRISAAIDKPSEQTKPLARRRGRRTAQ
jgi:hypothetical protein